MTQCVISGTGLYTPENKISNEELVTAFNHYVKLFNTEHQAQIERGEIMALQESSAEFIVKASGIHSRYVIDKTGILDPHIMRPTIPERSDEENSVQCEMALRAAEGALISARKHAQDIDAVIVACSNLQRPYPAMAIEIQHALGIEGFAFDMNVACSSATFGLQAAVDMLKSGSANCVLMVNPEICSGHLNFRDRDSHFIFGDACTAVIIERAENCTHDHGFEIISTRLKTQFSNNIRNNGGFLNRAAPEHRDDMNKLFYQQGRKVFKEVVPLVVEVIRQHIDENYLAVSDIKRFWLHQANANMNQLIAERLLGNAVQASQLPLILDTYANTSSAGSIIAFHMFNADLQAGDLGVICSFGAGYSIGSVLVRKRG
ncbi:MAG: beta-ketoacyl-ACP synthase III [Legionellales bacterium]|nr:beta-ketoacyl-ACP synthase III [Legionellales bacterium]